MDWESMDTIFVDDVPHEGWDSLSEIDLDEIPGGEEDE